MVTDANLGICAWMKRWEGREHSNEPYSCMVKFEAQLGRRSDSPGSLQNLGFAQNWQAGTKAKVGVHGARETPVPIPNTAVKPCSGYYTWPIKAWENSTMPNYRVKPPYRRLFLLYGKPMRGPFSPVTG